MKLKYIGKDGSMGLIKDRIYDCRITSNYSGCVWIVWQDPNDGREHSCPYGSLQAVADNWSEVKHGENNETLPI